jgi:hypothetical protein
MSKHIGEPVAWMHKQGNHEEPSFRQLDDWEISNGWTQQPLYTKPQPAPQGEPVAHQCKFAPAMDLLTLERWHECACGKKQFQGLAYTRPTPQPAQKQWVGLTDEEVEMIVENRRAAHWEFIRQVEAKLKEKNNG